MRAPLDLLASAVIVVTLVGGCPMRCYAQTPAPTPPATPASGLAVSAGYEAHRDRFRYEFENPSSFDTQFLVPHRFVQTYVADNHWFALSARYPLFGDVMETELGLAPRKTAFASDLDTLFDPAGDVIVAGTAGDVSMHSLRFSHWSEATLRRLAWRVGYVYRRDVSEFHSVERLGYILGAAVGIENADHNARDDDLPSARSTHRCLEADYRGTSLAADWRSRAWRRERWPLAFTLNYGRTWSYQTSNQFSRDMLQGGVRLGLHP